MLMPVGFATIIGGMCTTIGTSTNLLVVSMAADAGLERLGMFDFVIPAALTAGVGILYLWTVLPRILPERPTLLEGSDPRVFDSVISVNAGSPLVGIALSQAMRILGDGVRIHRIYRSEAIPRPI
jgi:di/tricarboxylate transporter